MSDRQLHCWKDQSEHLEEKFGFGSPEWAEHYGETGGTCMLPAGHTGDHVFTPDDQIGVTFEVDCRDYPS